MANRYLLNPNPNSWLKLTAGKKILEVDFASPRLDRSIHARIRAYRRGIQLADMGQFAEQIKWADVINFEGGDTPLLMARLKSIPDWQDNFDNKLVMAWSAGISCLTAYSFNVDYGFILKGLGILPYKSIVHYSPHRMWKWRRQLEMSYPEENLGLLLVKDDEYYDITL